MRAAVAAAAAAALLILCIFAVPAAQAGWVTDAADAARTAHTAHTALPHHVARYNVRHRRPALPRGYAGDCALAARLGGPCGCFAAQVFGLQADRALWRVAEWLRFPRAEPAPGTAAVWPGRHVAAVIAVHGDGTVTVNDSWNHAHRVRMAGLVFVRPR